MLCYVIKNPDQTFLNNNNNEHWTTIIHPFPSKFHTNTKRNQQKERRKEKKTDPFLRMRCEFIKALSSFSFTLLEGQAERQESRNSKQLHCSCATLFMSADKRLRNRKTCSPPPINRKCEQQQQQTARHRSRSTSNQMNWKPWLKNNTKHSIQSFQGHRAFTFLGSFLFFFRCGFRNLVSFRS